MRAYLSAAKLMRAGATAGSARERVRQIGEAGAAGSAEAELEIGEVKRGG